MDEYDDGQPSRRDELRVEVVEELLSVMLSAAEAAELEMPHIVICRDEETGTESYSGPFPNGLAALVFAERESMLDLAHNDGRPLDFRVAAIFPTDLVDAT